MKGSELLWRASQRVGPDKQKDLRSQVQKDLFGQGDLSNPYPRPLDCYHRTVSWGLYFGLILPNNDDEFRLFSTLTIFRLLITLFTKQACPVISQKPILMAEIKT
jgi:hypothetical protein